MLLDHNFDFFFLVVAARYLVVTAHYLVVTGGYRSLPLVTARSHFYYERYISNYFSLYSVLTMQCIAQK